MDPLSKWNILAHSGLGPGIGGVDGKGKGDGVGGCGGRVVDGRLL